MADYQQMYLVLFRKVTKAIALLQEAQLEVEEFFLSSDEINVLILPPYSGAGKNNEEQSPANNS